MKTLFILLSAVFLMGCPTKDEAAIDPPERDVPIEAVGDAKAEVEIPELVPPVAVPEEYREAAKRDITEENAEAVAAELEKEIEADDE